MIHERPRKSIRLKNYNYNNNGMYFVTLLSKNRANLFGCFSYDGFLISEIGKVIENHWEMIPMHFESVILDEFIIMPNHIHGIIQIRNEIDSKTEKHTYQNQTPKSLSTIISSYKASATRTIRKEAPNLEIWQRNYYEHVIRTEEELKRCREYIRNNPLKWQLDRNNPMSKKLMDKGSIY